MKGIFTALLLLLSVVAFSQDLSVVSIKRIEKTIPGVNGHFCEITATDQANKTYRLFLPAVAWDEIRKGHKITYIEDKELPKVRIGSYVFFDYKNEFKDILYN